MYVGWLVIINEVVYFFVDSVGGVDDVLMYLNKLCVWVASNDVSFRQI